MSPELEREDLSRLGYPRGGRPEDTLGLQTKLGPTRTEPLEGGDSLQGLGPYPLRKRPSGIGACKWWRLTMLTVIALFYEDWTSMLLSNTHLVQVICHDKVGGKTSHTFCISTLTLHSLTSDTHRGFQRHVPSNHTASVDKEAVDTYFWHLFMYYITSIHSVNQI